MTLQSIVLDTTRLVNSSNPTLVATWDVSDPPERERGEVPDIRLRFSGAPETLGPDGDRRTRVEAADFAPGGKYRAVCKLQMSYSSSESEYMGTGWLIADDLVVTAGHCSFGSDVGYLKWMKVHIGYESEASVGTVAHQSTSAASVAMPAEYLKAETGVHDVSFIKLKKKFTEFDSGSSSLIRYEDTPQSATINLGVVGYPGDRNFGAYMFEHWSQVRIDLARSRGVLEYKVDTTGGQSGSPVFRSDDSRLRSIGVHVRGGWPNSASVIGTLGNIFMEYLRAMKVHIDGVVTSGTSIVTPTGSPPAPRFQMISVASLATEAAGTGALTSGAGSASTGDGPSGSSGEAVSDADVAALSKLLIRIFGSFNNACHQKAQSNDGVATST